jgi:hypothetical protein
VDCCDHVRFGEWKRELACRACMEEASRGNASPSAQQDSNAGGSRDGVLTLSSQAAFSDAM